MNLLKQNRLLMIAFAAIAFMGTAKAELRVDIFEGKFNPIPVAIHDFVGDDTLSQNITGVVSNDLKNCGLFNPIDKGAFIQSKEDAFARPRHEDWRMIGAHGLVTGRISDAGSGKFKVEFFLHDVLAGTQMLGFQFVGTEKDWRRIAHKISDSIYERMTGDKGFFDTKIVYAAKQGTGKAARSRIAMIDQDGANLQYVTDANGLALTPRFSSNLRTIAFMDYGKDRKTPRVYLMENGTKRQVGHYKNMTLAPRFSPDGSKLVMSLSDAQGGSSIHVMDLNSKTVRQLTPSNSTIDVSADFDPEGRRIVFNSDRGGGQQIYTMNADGSNPQRISFGKGTYTSPVWSPRGDLIAFTKLEGGTFYVGIMKTDGSGERLIASGYLVEEPSWAPNGRVITFTRQDRGGQAKLHMIDFTGYNERPIPTPGNENALSPFWSVTLP